jgi:hypothetical protein
MVAGLWLRKGAWKKKRQKGWRQLDPYPAGDRTDPPACPVLAIITEARNKLKFMP